MLSFKRITVIIVSLHSNKVSRTESYLLGMPVTSLIELLLASSDPLNHRPEERQVKAPEICALHKSCVSVGRFLSQYKDPKMKPSKGLRVSANSYFGFRKHPIRVLILTVFY